MLHYSGILIYQSIAQKLPQTSVGAYFLAYRNF